MEDLGTRLRPSRLYIRTGKILTSFFEFSRESMPNTSHIWYQFVHLVPMVRFRQTLTLFVHIGNEL
jgi:hypothetical protein